MKGEFSVVQFFDDGTHEYVRRWVDIPTAIQAVKDSTRSLGAKVGTTVRVIVTDGGDCTCFEWTYGVGITFPVGDVTLPD